MVSILRQGYALTFRDRPPLSRRPLSFSDSRNPERDALIAEQFLKLLDKRAIEEVRDPSTPGFYSRLFVVPKKTGGWRPVIDLSVLNTYMMIPKFKMETLKSIRAGLHKDHWMFSLDLEDAYLHIPIHGSSRKYLRMQFRGRVYQFRSLPFGLSTAPWVFTKVMSQVAIMSHLDQHLLFQYLDDWLEDCPSLSLAYRRVRELVSLVQHLGLLVNFKKSELIPQQRFVFVGALFDLTMGLVFPTQDHVSDILRAVQAFLRASTPTALGWQSLLGILGSQEQFIPFGRLHIRPLQLHLQSLWSASRDLPSTPIPLSKEVESCLRWWLHVPNLSRGVPLVPPPFSVRIFTDASTMGWGAHVEGKEFQGTWSPADKLNHINVLEMRAITLTLQRLPLSPGDSILAATDNTTVVAYINKQGGTHSRSLWNETVALFDLVMSLRVSIWAKHIPGRLNVIADQLSRQGQILPTEWSLHPDVVNWLFLKWGSPLVDLFATRYNAKRPLFVSPVPDPQALDTDALSVDWEGMWAYAFPPRQLLPAVLRKIKEVKLCQVILVAPYWPSRSWFPQLLDLSLCPPLQLPQWRSLLKQPQSDIFCPLEQLQMLNLHAWLLGRKH